jgi:hypothetical protein
MILYTKELHKILLDREWWKERVCEATASGLCECQVLIPADPDNRDGALTNLSSAVTAQKTNSNLLWAQMSSGQEYIIS